MDGKITFIRTAKGEEEIRSRRPSLSGDIKRALLMVDGKSSFDEISKHAAPSLRGMLDDAFKELLRSGFIQDKAREAQAGNIPKMAVPPKPASPAASGMASQLKKPAKETDLDELDFTAAFRVPTPEILAAEGARLEAERMRKEAEAQAEAVRQKAEQEAARGRAELAAAQAKAEAEARAHAEAAASARKEIEAAKFQAQQEAEAARLKAEQEAAGARKVAEQARRLVAAAQAKAEAEARAHAEAAASARKEIEAAKFQAQQEAEAARLKAEQEAAQARAELATAQAKAEAEARARAEAEARAHEEIEAVKLKARQEAEAARFKAEQDAAAAREEAEQAKRQAEEAARLKAEQAAAQARAELAEAQAKAEAELSRRQAAEAQAEVSARKEAEAMKLKVQQEAEAARLKAEQDAAKAREEALKAREEAIMAREEAEQARQLLMEAQAKAEVEALAHAEADANARKETEAAKLKAQQEAEAVRHKAEREASKAREEAIMAHEEAEQAKQLVVEAQAKAEHEALALAEVEIRTHKEIEVVKLKAQQEAEAARLKAEQEASRAREDAVTAREEAITAREEAEQARQLVAEAQAKAEVEALAHAEAAVEARKEIEATKLKLQQEAEAARVKAEQDAAKAREEAEEAKRLAAEAVRARVEVERRAREQAEQAEQARLKAEQEAALAKAEIEAAMQKLQKEADAARLKAEQEAALAREEAEELKRQAAEAKAHAHDETAGKAGLQEAEAARIEEESLKAEQEAQRLARMAATLKSAGAKYQRSTSATVLFFDVVGYTKQPVNKQIKIKKRFNQLVSDCLAELGDDERIILDTGDGAAIGFLQHPEDALEVARQFRNAVTAHQHKDYPELEVRTGIHLGPVSIVKDMNGQSNMVGDGINDAQRIMSFAGIDQIYISRPYYDFISRLSDEYANLFQYRGLQQDKHGREHAVYELVDFAAAEAAPRVIEAAPPITLEPFIFAASEIVVNQSAPVAHEEIRPQEQPVSAFSEIKLDMMDTQEAVPPVPEAKPADVPPPAAPAEQVAMPVQPAVKQEAKAEAHMPTEEDVAAMAASQAKVWAKAEQRAAQAKEERAAQPPQPVQRKEEPVVHARRKPVPWGKVGAGLFVLAIVALFVAPFVLPMREYASGIEQKLSAQLKQPVHIGQISGRILPTPQLELGEVSVGETKQVQVKLVRLDFAISALFSSTKAIDSLGLEGLQVNGSVLQRLPDWLQQIAADTQYPVEHVELSQSVLDADGLQLSGIAGEMNFDAAGQFAQAKLQANDGKYALAIEAVQGGRLKADITVRGSLPLLPDWTFDELSASGELTRDKLIISELDGSIMDGRLLGKLELSWAAGWQAQGDLIARVVTVQKFGTALSGDMDGTARFRMQADSLAKLVDSSVVDGTFVVSKGVISGFDIVETARLRLRTSQPGGRTHFDELSGDLGFENGNYRFRRLKMKAGVLNATGSLDVAKQQLSGQVTAELSMRTGMGSAALQVGGTTGVPTVRIR